VAATGEPLKPRVSLTWFVGDESMPLAPWARYLATLVLVGIALAARFAMWPVNGGVAFITFYPVVIAAAMLFGTGPAAFAIVLSGTCADYFFLPPYGSFGLGFHQGLTLAIYGLTGGLTCLLAHLMRKAVAELRLSEQRLRGLYEAPHIGIALTDIHGRYVQFNDAFRKICGYSADELRALDYWALTPTKYAADEARQLESLHSVGHYGPYEKEYIRKDGSLIPLQLNGALLKGSDGESYIWSIVEDITERRQLEGRLAAESARNRLFLRMASDGVHILNAAGRIVEASDSFCRMLGYTRDEIIGMHPSQWDARLSPEGIRLTLDKLLSGGLRRFETRHRRKNGATVEVEVHADSFDFNGERYIFCSARDITDQKRLERAVLEATDREQRRLGHDLHDGLGQELTGISMLASALAATERKAGRPGADAITQLEELSRRAIATCRAVARGLSPLGYASGGLVEALQEMVSLQRDTFATDARFESIMGASLRLGADACDHLYRIAQEAVTNARRHGRAKLIQVTLDVEPATVRLEVLDDGVGLPPPAADAPGMGLRIMRFRARMIGARLSIGPGDHGGTLVTCESPQPAESQEALRA
jgi:PAS domain S-box-containing protein